MTELPKTMGGLTAALAMLKEHYKTQYLFAIKDGDVEKLRYNHGSLFGIFEMEKAVNRAAAEIINNNRVQLYEMLNDIDSTPHRSPVE